MRQLLIFLLFICSGQTASAQNISLDSIRIENETYCVDDLTINNMSVLCRVWGFVKYHHPAMADSTIDMDSELFGLLPQMINVSTKKRNEVLLEWIDRFGSFEMNNTKYDSMLCSPNHRLIADAEWIKHSTELGKQLSLKLQDMRYAKREGNHYMYYAFSPGGHLKFDREKQYKQTSPVPDTRYRLLGLFRYWNIIEYFFPHKGLMDRNWQEVLIEYIPRFIKAGNFENYVLTICELTTNLNDSHAYTYYFSPYIFGTNKLPVKASIIDGQLVVLTSETPRKGAASLLNPGDIIERIDGHPIDSVIAKIKKYAAQSNETTLLRDVGWNAFYSAKAEMKLTYIRDSNQIESTFELWSPGDFRDYKPEEQELYRLLADSILYIRPVKYNPEEQKERIKNLLLDAKGAIFDFRGVGSDLFKLFIDVFYPDKIDFVKIMVPDADIPGYFYLYNYGLGEENDTYYRGKIVVLVNYDTQSSKEFNTMMLQALPNTRVIGSQTAGADGNIAYITFPGNLTTQFSAIGLYYPDGGETQRVGVRLDEVVEPTIEGIKAGRDEVLERAIEIINSSTDF